MSSDNYFNDNKIINKLNQKKIIIKNVLKMLIERKILEEDKLTEIYENIIKKNIELNNFEIEIPVKSILVTFIDSKITSYRKIEDIDKIINNNKHNIFIINDIQSKIWELLIKNEIEVFMYKELMTNVIEHDIVPKHILLNDDEKKIFLNEYHNQLNKLPKIELFDPISRYYNVKIGDIFRIIRPSIITGNNIYYRIVIDGSIPTFDF